MISLSNFRLISCNFVKKTCNVIQMDFGFVSADCGVNAWFINAMNAFKSVPFGWTSYYFLNLCSVFNRQKWDFCCLCTRSTYFLRHGHWTSKQLVFSTAGPKFLKPAVACRIFLRNIFRAFLSTLDFQHHFVWQRDKIHSINWNKGAPIPSENKVYNSNELCSF